MAAQDPQAPAEPPAGAPEGRRRPGRPRGAKNKTTLERERQADLERQRLAIIDGAVPAEAELARAAAAGVKLGKDVLRDFMRLFAGLAATVQPLPPGAQAPPGHQVDEVKFERWAVIAADLAHKLAPFESPKFSAVMVGATTINKVEVVGGMPNDFAAPPGVPAQQLAPGTIIEAEEGYVPPAAAAG